MAGSGARYRRSERRNQRKVKYLHVVPQDDLEPRARRFGSVAHDGDGRTNSKGNRPSRGIVELVSLWEGDHDPDLTPISSIQARGLTLARCEKYLEHVASIRGHIPKRALDRIQALLRTQTALTDKPKHVLSVFDKVTQSGFDVRKLSSNPALAIRNGKAEHVLDVVSNYCDLLSVLDTVERAQMREPEIGSRPFRIVSVSSSDRQLVELVRGLTDDLEEFVRAWQSGEVPPKIKDGLPEHVKQGLMCACEHVIACLKRETIDLETLSGIARTVLAIKKLATITYPNTVTAGVTAVATVAATLALSPTSDADKALRAVDGLARTCTRILEGNERVHSELKDRWERREQGSSDFDFGQSPTA